MFLNTIKFPEDVVQLKKLSSTTIESIFSSIGKLKPISVDGKYSPSASFKYWHDNPLMVKNVTGLDLSQIISFLTMVSTNNRSTWIKASAHPEFSIGVPLGLSCWKRHGIGYMEWDRNLKDDVFYALLIDESFREFIMNQFTTLQALFKLMTPDTIADKSREEFMKEVTGVNQWGPKICKDFDLWNALPKPTRCYVMGTWVFEKPTELTVVNINDMDSREPSSPWWGTKPASAARLSAAAIDWTAMLAK
jgi:hypothetical protein